MTLDSVRSDLARRAPDLLLVETEASTATVADAAQALGVVPGRIAKTLAIDIGGAAMLLVAAGDARLDNAKAKAALGAKPRMLAGEAATALTSHPVGGVCPFGLPAPLPIACDVSLRAYRTVFPAAGARNASVEITPERLAALTGGRWVDACKVAP